MVVIVVCVCVWGGGGVNVRLEACTWGVRVPVGW